MCRKIRNIYWHNDSAETTGRVFVVRLYDFALSMLLKRGTLVQNSIQWTGTGGRVCISALAMVRDVVKELVPWVTNPNKVNVLRLTPLHLETGYKMVTPARALVYLGSDANVVDNDGVLLVEIAEAFLREMQKMKIFLENADYAKLEEFVQVLDASNQFADGEVEG